MAILEKWEYRWVKKSESNLKIEGSLLDKLKTETEVRAVEKFLNEMGNEGWEWIPPHLIPNNETGIYFLRGYLFFRRRVSP